MTGWARHVSMCSPQLSNQFAYTPNFQLAHTFRPPASELNILLGERKCRECDWKGAGRSDWWTERRPFPLPCEPPRGAPRQIVNASQTSGRKRREKWRICIKENGNWFMGSLCLLCWHGYVKSHAPKVTCQGIAIQKFISLPNPEFLQTVSRPACSLPVCDIWKDLLGGKWGWWDASIGQQPSSNSHEVRCYMMFCCQTWMFDTAFWISSLRVIYMCACTGRWMNLFWKGQMWVWSDCSDRHLKWFLSCTCSKCLFSFLVNYQ